MGECMSTIGIALHLGQRALDPGARRVMLPDFRQRHAVMTVEPPVLTVVGGEPAKKIDEVLFPAGQPGHSDQPTLIGGKAQDQRVAGPGFKMGTDSGQRSSRLAGEQVTKDLNMAEIARRICLAERLGRGEGIAHGREVTGKLEGACLADISQGEAWVSSDGAVERRGGAGIDG